MSTPEIQALAGQLAAAHAGRSTLAELPAALVPADEPAAYAVQLATLAERGSEAAGWKVGSKSHDGPIQGAPLPAEGVSMSPATVERGAFGVLGLELEIGFVFGEAFEPAGHPYSDDAVMAGVQGMVATIEIVSSRFADWPRTDKLVQLADLQNHGALIVGEPVPYRAAFPFLRPPMRFSLDGADLIQGTPANPAGDPRRLLPWLVNHWTGLGRRVAPGMVATAGSYTGIYFPERPGVYVGEIAGLPPVRLTIA
ncbi:MAG: 2-keto-4-pentenoate hydratase [Burkholderiales bacterium]|nr:2-keto-4-pentenoate hydratase [Burkholderiales bacterium]